MSNVNRGHGRRADGSLNAELEKAEELRLAQDYDAAREQFSKLLNDDFGTLSHRQRAWCLAHYGAALCESFIPYDDREHFLDEAKEQLEHALDMEQDYPWASHWLGEVYRFKGMLPVFVLTEGTEPGLVLEVYDRMQIVLNGIARFSPRFHQSPWALAHAGAMYLNCRGYWASGTDQNIIFEARELLEEAIRSKDGGFHYPWAQNYMSALNFMKGVEDIAHRLLESKYSGVGMSEDEDVCLERSFALSIFYLIISLAQEPSPSFRYLMQPGTVALDPWAGMIHDFFNLLPERQNPGIGESKFLYFLWYLLGVGSEYVGSSYFGQDATGASRDKPQLTEVRYRYAVLFIRYFGLTEAGETSERTILEAASALVDELDKVTWPPGPWKIADVGSSFLLRAFDALVVLMKASVILEYKQVDDQGLLQRINDRMLQLSARFRLSKIVFPEHSGLDIDLGLNLETGDNSFDIALIRKNMFELVDRGERWLLHPVWPVSVNVGPGGTGSSTGPDRFTTLKRMFGIKD